MRVLTKQTWDTNTVEPHRCVLARIQFLAFSRPPGKEHSGIHGGNISDRVDTGRNAVNLVVFALLMRMRKATRRQSLKNCSFCAIEGPLCC